MGMQIFFLKGARSALAADSRALGKLHVLLPEKGRSAGRCLLQMDPGDSPQVRHLILLF